MSRQELPKDQSAWDWVFGGGTPAGAGTEGEGTEGSGVEGTDSSESRGPGDTRVELPEGIRGVPGIGRSAEREGDRPPVLEDPVQGPEGLYRMSAGEAGVHRFQIFREVPPAGLPARPAPREGLSLSEERWRRAVVTAVILSPPKAGRWHRRPW